MSHLWDMKNNSCYGIIFLFLTLVFWSFQRMCLCVPAWGNQFNTVQRVWLGLKQTSKQTDPPTAVIIPVVISALCVCYISEWEWILGSQQHLYMSIIRKERVWQMDYNCNWECGESVVLAAAHLLCLWCNQLKETRICLLLQIACRITKCVFFSFLEVPILLAVMKKSVYIIWFYYSKADGRKWGGMGGPAALWPSCC